MSFSDLGKQRGLCRCGKPIEGRIEVSALKKGKSGGKSRYTRVAATSGGFCGECGVSVYTLLAEIFERAHKDASDVVP